MFLRRRETEENDEINISPLIDMVFILLIFFVVTATFTRETGVKVQRPRASSAKQVRKKNIMIAVTSEGTIHIHNRQVTLEHLTVILKNLAQDSPDSDAVVMADRNARMETVVKVIDACKRAGLQRVSIGALKEKL